jgi:hypothetical protein
LRTSSQVVYERTITAPFSGQAVAAQILLPNSPSPASAKIVARATTGKVTQQATVNVEITWGFPAAIISVSPGTTSKDVDKSAAQGGNVVMAGNASGRTIVDGGLGKAVLANGRLNVGAAATLPMAAVSTTNYNTANEIPDYTTQGTADTLFEFNRFIAVADLTTNALNPTRNNHFTNLATFISAANAAALSPAKALEGVVVVDIKKSDKEFDSLDPSNLPHGINVKGTLFFKFEAAFDPMDKIINTAAMNINPANLTSLVATNPATYPSGYPPVYYDNSKNPTNINITSKGFANFTAEEDLPAVLYSIGTLDIHGNANICGVMYTPSFMEIENKQDGQVQYIKGSLIMGQGIYYENNSKATSIISFDPNALDSLATQGNAGKSVTVAYWE